MIKIVTTAEMRAIEAAAVETGMSYAEMMENAGRTVAERVKQILDELEIPEPHIAVLVGPGNNGGDGLVAARIIALETQATVQLFLSKPREDDQNLNRAYDAKIPIIDAPTDAERGYRVLRSIIASADVVIDALLGTGTKLPIRGDMATILDQVAGALKDREADRPKPHLVTPGVPTPRLAGKPIILAVDVPTGMDSDTGALDSKTLVADETLSLEAAKIGHIAPGAADAVGVLHIAPLKLPEKLDPRDAIKRTLIDAGTVRDLLPKRPANANKGTFGKALIVAGSANYSGAPTLAAQSAYTVGAGLVTVAAVSPIVPIIASHLLEATFFSLPHESGALNANAAQTVQKEMSAYTAMLVGPGLGQDPATGDFLKALFQPDVKFPKLVIDADGLNLLAKMENWWTLLPPRTILTPHVGEMARLAKIEAQGDRKATEIVLADRLTLAAEKAATWNCIVVLKGAYTVIADPDSRIAVLPFATAALARAGTGDVLAGAITGYLAQGLDPFDAAIVAGYIHGYAGLLSTDILGTAASVLASDIIAAMPESIATIEG